MGGLPVERITYSVKLFKPSQRVCYLQQRPSLVVPESPENFFWRRVQIHRLGSGAQISAVSGAQYRPATGRQYAGRVLGKLTQHDFFNITKSRFAFALKILFDQAAYPLFYHLVRVIKPSIQPAR